VLIDVYGVNDVFSNVDWTLDQQFARLTLTGSAVVGVGNASSNEIFGNTAGNVLDGAGGIDELTGGAGADLFVLGSPVVGTRADLITDFSRMEGDRLVIPAQLFAADQSLDIAIIASRSELNAAYSSTDVLIYNSSDGSLYLNANGDSFGSGSDGGLLAKIHSSGMDAPVPAALSAADFVGMPAERDQLTGLITTTQETPTV